MSREKRSSVDLKTIIDHAAHLLPAQGPIGVFIHHNTLHAFQHLLFEDAVVEAAKLFRAEPYMTEARFREELNRGRILPGDIDWVIAREPDEPVVDGLTRRILLSSMLVSGVRSFEPVSIAWCLEEGDLAHDFRSQENRQLFDACLRRTAPVLMAPETVEDPAHIEIQSLLIRLCNCYLDQGLSYWPMPGREAGFYLAVRRLMSQPGSFQTAGLEGIELEFRSQEKCGWSAEETVRQLLGPDVSVWEKTIKSELLAMPGWPGLFRRLEEEPALAPHDRLPCRLIDYIAVRLTLLRVARGKVGAPEPCARPSTEAIRMARAAELYEAARCAGISAARVSAWSEAVWLRFTAAVDAAANETDRRRLYHLAYERHHEQEILLGIAAHYKEASTPPARRLRPVAQVFFCIDEREESIRRALEEVDPLVETFGAAGFFGVAVDYTGIDDAHGAALCPVVVKPQHAVNEKPMEADREQYETRRTRRRIWAKLSRHLFVSSRSLVRGAFSTAVLGLLSAVPLIAKVLAPRQFGLLRDALNRAFFPEPRTELTLMRNSAASHEKVEGLLLGFSVTEKADRVASVLTPAGLKAGFARIVVVLGHGSTSLNNPHESAHDCGACGGRRGGPNARLFAAMANHPQVREELAKQGIAIPDDTWFVGGYHDTCSDDVDLFDTDQIPPSHSNDFTAIRASLDLARARNAHERARRFESFSRAGSFSQALWHVEERAEHLAEPRPEYGHCTNAVAVVGRRQLTRNLFMDRRAFLISYDATQDAENRSIAQVLGAVIPVCAGISLEYYFSFVDNERYGCGTKLPHNISGLQGVMNGNSSDLRTGLPLQMVEIHEPVRILFVIETTPERLEPVLMANPTVKEFVVNRWIRVSTIDPETGRVHIRRDSGYEELYGTIPVLPTAPSSADWYRGHREHLPMAVIRAEEPA